MRSLEDYIIDMEKRNGAIMEHANSDSFSDNNNKRVDSSARSGGDSSASASEKLMVSNEDIWTQLKHKENDLQLAAELGKALLDKNERLQKQNDAIQEEFSKKLEEVEQDRHILKRKFANRESEYEARIAELQNDLVEAQNKISTKEQTIKQCDKEKSSLVTELTAQNLRLTTQLKDSMNVERRLQQEIEVLKDQCAMGRNNLQEHMSSVDRLRDELDLLVDQKEQLERRLHLSQSEKDQLTGALEESQNRVHHLERHFKDLEMRYQHSLNGPQETLQIDHRSFNNSDHRSLLVEMDISEPTLSQECMSVYRRLRGLCQQLKSNQTDDREYDDDSGLHSDCSTGADPLDDKPISAGLLSEVAQELVTLVLDTDVVRILDRLERARREIQERDLEMQRRSDTVIELTRKLSVCEVELQAALEERDRARHDAAHSSLNQDEVVSKAREVRDQAVTRKNKAEVELAKIRVELLQANSQLMEAIQQKVELSQQLEQWQMDMQELIDEQLKNKLSSQEIKMREEATESTAITKAATRRILLFFQR